MAQTRAISRACRSAFAHVVVMMNAGLSTTPAEEVPAEGFDDAPAPQPLDLDPIIKANSMEALQAAYSAALKRHKGADARTAIVAAKDKRKAQLLAVAAEVSDVDLETGEVI